MTERPGSPELVIRDVRERGQELLVARLSLGREELPHGLYSAAADDGNREPCVQPRRLRAMAAQIPDAKVRQVFEANAVSTHNHYLLIESEYARLMGMVHETDIDIFVRE